MVCKYVCTVYVYIQIYCIAIYLYFGRRPTVLDQDNLFVVTFFSHINAYKNTGTQTKPTSWPDTWGEWRTGGTCAPWSWWSWRQCRAALWWNLKMKTVVVNMTSVCLSLSLSPSADVDVWRKTTRHLWRAPCKAYRRPCCPRDFHSAGQQCAVCTWWRPSAPWSSGWHTNNTERKM